MNSFEDFSKDTLKEMGDESKGVLGYLVANPDKYTLIGSRALGCANKGSDFDFICHIDNLTDYLKATGIVLDIKNYVNVMPMGNGNLVKYMSYIDLLVYDDQRDVVALKKAIKYMQVRQPILEEFYQNKDCRVRMFEGLYKHFQQDRWEDSNEDKS